jgi:leucyl-tRNA synthetase
MSKSKNNGVDPQGLVEKYGADTARLFMMFASPPEQTLEWSDEGVLGQARFLRRLWRAVHEHVSAGAATAKSGAAAAAGAAVAVAAAAPGGERAGDAGTQLRRVAHQTLVRVGDDIGRRRTFNTAIAAVMELLNTVGRFQVAAGDAAAHALRHEALEIAVLCLSPIVPHICHVLWHELGHEGALIDEPWPQPDPAALAQDTVELIVQVNGKLRGRVRVPSGADESVARAASLADPDVQRFMGGVTPKRVVYVAGKLVNIVV